MADEKLMPAEAAYHRGHKDRLAATVAVDAMAREIYDLSELEQQVMKDRIIQALFDMRVTRGELIQR